MKKVFLCFSILIPLLFFGCDELPPDMIIEYSTPPQWLQQTWVDSLINIQYRIEVTSENIVLYYNNQKMYDFSELDETRYMRVVESSGSFVVTVTAASQPRLVFSFTKRSEDEIEFSLEHPESAEAINPKSFVPYQELGSLDIEIVLPDDPIVLILSSIEYENSYTVEADLTGETYQWFIDGVEIPDQTQKTLTINKDEISDNSTIICKVVLDGREYFDKLILSIDS